MEDETKDDCWFEHQWTPWKKREVEMDEGWLNKPMEEEYRECRDCHEFQTRAVS